ncbi:MAG TPA: hypothetical protein VMS08_01370, partial [Candidatus Saccharimonadia bacterium]|nr:hypothetical protein [Candidatus Saccharimonadia bacterium]
SDLCVELDRCDRVGKDSTALLLMVLRNVQPTSMARRRPQHRRARAHTNPASSALRRMTSVFQTIAN